MKFFNITTQQHYQAWQAEHLTPLENAIDSLLQYMHYYIPEWRILGSIVEYDNNATRERKYISSEKEVITKDTILYTIPPSTDKIIDIDKLHFRWGIKNESSAPYIYGNNRTLNIGASLYKKDAYDIDTSDNPNWEEVLSHFIVFESSLAQYYNWNFSGGVNQNGDFVLVYNYFLTNELEFGLSYSIQMAEQAPRYFFFGVCNPGASVLDMWDATTYKIRYRGESFDTGSLYDYNNTNIQVVETVEGVVTRTPNYDEGEFVPQRWQGNSALITQVLYEEPVAQNSHIVHREEVIGDVILYQRQGSHAAFQVRLDKNVPAQEETRPVEEKLSVVFS